MIKDSKTDQIQKRVVGKRIVFENQSKQSPQYQIIILNYHPSDNFLSKCSFGIIKNTHKLVIVKRIENNKKLNDVGAYQQFKKSYQNQLNNLHEASRQHKMSQHSNIVDVYPISLISTKRTHAYIIMEFCRGGNLQTQLSLRRLQGSWFTFGQIFNMMKQIINGYDQLYTRSILHQNLKPSNIFIDMNILKIGDFSLSLKIKDSKQNPKIFGSPYYTAPQKYSPNYEPSSLSDIFSLGVIFYELIFDEHPYCKNVQNYKMKIQYITKKKIDQKILNEISQNKINEAIESKIICKNQQQAKNLQKLKQIVYCMLAKNPKQRINLQQIKVKIQQLILVPTEPLVFINKISIPQKLNYVIQKQSSLNSGVLNFKPLQLEDIRKSCTNKIYLLRQNAQKTNILSNLLYSIMRRIQMQIQQREIRDEQLTKLPRQLLKLNYSLTYKKYNQLLVQISQLQQKKKLQYYSTNLDSLITNTRKNNQLLQWQLLNLANSNSNSNSSSNPNPNSKQQQQTISSICQSNLPNRTYEQIFDDMKQYLHASIISNQAKILDDCNVHCYVFVALLAKLVNMGPCFTLEEIEGIMAELRVFENNFQHFTIKEISALLRLQGIQFGLVNFDNV